MMAEPGPAPRARTATTTVATTAFTAVSNLLGGPVGIAIAVIGGLVYWWNSVKNAADASAVIYSVFALLHGLHDISTQFSAIKADLFPPTHQICHLGLKRKRSIHCQENSKTTGKPFKTYLQKNCESKS